MARSYVSRAKRDAGAKRGKFRKLTQATPGGSYDGKPAEDDPRFNPKKHGNKHGNKRDSKAPNNNVPAFNQRNWQNA